MCQCEECVAARESFLWVLAFVVTAALCTGLLVLVTLGVRRLSAG
jgi:hypothetical protein